MFNFIKNFILNNNFQKEYKTIKNDFDIYYEKLNFNTKNLDSKIENLADKIYAKYKKDFNSIKEHKNKYSFLATQIYETGGHTSCIVSLAKSLQEGNSKIPLYFSKLKSCLKRAPKKTFLLKNYTEIKGIQHKKNLDISKTIKLYNLIINDSPEVIYVYIHPNDITSSIVLSLIKKTTNIKTIFFNHASHYPTLGMKFCDLILEGMPTTQKITNEKRGYKNNKIIGLQSCKKEEINYATKEELSEIRTSLGIEKNNQITISGGSAYKFFKNDSSKYFELIKEILEIKPNLTHTVMTNLNKAQEEILNSIFSSKKELKERLLFINQTPDFEKYFQLADVFIDSFPVSSALTQIDLMKLKVASVVKINKDVLQWSFHEYMPENYPYMFENIEDMKNGILELLDNPKKRKEAIELNYNHWLETYEEESYIKKFKNIINEVINV